MNADNKNKSIVLETQRCLLREMTVNDAEHAYLLNFDPEVIQYTGDVAFISVEEARKFLENYDHYKKYNFGRWAVIEKNSGEFLGWCGLKYDSFEKEHDIGFRFFKKHWGKGYATETAKACIEFGFKKYKIDRIVGRAMKENLASINVLEKCGLKFYGESFCAGHEALIYEIYNSV